MRLSLAVAAALLALSPTASAQEEEEDADASSSASTVDTVEAEPVEDSWTPSMERLAERFAWSQPAPTKVHAGANESLRPVQSTLKWSYFGARLLVDVIEPHLAPQADDGSINFPRQDDRCVQGPHQADTVPIQALSPHSCWAPKAGLGDGAVLLAPRVYVDGRLGLLLTGRL